MVNFYFLSLIAKFCKKFIGLPLYLVKLLCIFVWTEMPVHMVCTDQGMCINVYTRLQTPCFQFCRQNVDTSSFRRQLDKESHDPPPAFS